jgi:predicted RNase H-like nuclease
VYFVGVDLAWGERNPTGVAVVDDAGELAHVAAAGDDAAILARLRPFTAGECVVAIDAPLVVTNPVGNRPCEAALNRDFRAFHAGAHPTNTGRPWFANGSRGGRLADALGLDLDPHSASGRRALEVYPHAATVALFNLDRTLKYKHKTGRDTPGLRAELLRLMDLVEGLADATPRLGVRGHREWAALRDTVTAATRKAALRSAQDPVDAVVCAYVALYTVRRPADITVYGDPTTGCIVTPTLVPNPARCPDASDR